MDAQQDRLDREMLRSMAASFSSGLGFSFNAHDMAELMQRMAERVDPKPRRADLARPKVRALTKEDREWIDAEADRLFRESERQRGGVRPATITPQDYRDYFVVEATYRRILAALEE